MVDLHKLSNDELFDVLSSETAAYFKMLAGIGSQKDFANCKSRLKLIHEEVNKRKMQKTQAGKNGPG